ncbi:hypothetical protein HNY73_004067 [Argiope bruennichi]|uniref:SOCS box domain-containing protein n=1 Tax=Argiope bruennichi TaxID=94029 RepID=A0A8T0FMR0_ARGBR|nr:hypothetical protein HNY73_004067 [Argiope bruennichi]
MHLKTSKCSAHIEEVIRKFIKVCTVLDLQTELTREDVHQYEFMADLLKVCYEANIQDSQMVTTLVKMVIDRCKVELSDIRYVKQPHYPLEFFKYILEHVINAKFDIVSYCNDNPRTLWEYSRNFSVVSAVSFGNKDRTLALLKYGFEVFPEYEARRSGHGFPFIEEVVPKAHQIVLQMMSVMRSLNLIIMNSTHYSNNGLLTLTKDQKECFRLIWRAIPEAFVKFAEMGLSITAEYFHLAQHGILEPVRYEENTKSCIMYEMCFKDMASGAREPRSLQHLCRCTVRKSLRESWNLPHGIYKLGLPKILELYLNLEFD